MTHPIGDRFGVEQSVAPSTTIHASVEISAPPDVVFRALADPRELVAWLGDEWHELSTSTPVDGHPPSAPSTNANSGASWLAHIRAPDGTPGTVSGEFLYVVPPRSLTTTWSASWNRFLQDEVTFELTPIEVAGGAGTRVTVTHRRRELFVRHATIASARATLVAENDAWVALLARLSAYVTTIEALARWSGPAHDDLTHAFDALHRRVVALHRGEIE